MGIRTRAAAWLGALGLMAPVAMEAQEGFSCLTSEQVTLLQAVNDYRAQHSLPPVPWSLTLTTVGQHHAEDALKNSATIFSGSCNPHSWSFDRPELWSGGCYTSDHANATLMWHKPREISGGAFRGFGYELGAGGYGSPASALRAWQNSPGHNPVMINEGVWSRYTWRAMGVGIAENRYYFLWFSDSADNRPAAQACEGPVFVDSFEQEP